MKDVQLKWIYRLVIVLLGSSAIYMFMKISPIWLPIFTILKIVFVPLIISIFITYLLHPLIEKIHYRGVPRPIAILLIYILFFAGVGFGLYRGIPAIISQLRDLIDSFPELMGTYREWLARIEQSAEHLPKGLHERIDETFLSLEQSLDQMVTNLIEILRGLIGSIIFFAIIPFIVFYMLKDYDQMKKALWYLTPRKWRHSSQMFIRDIDESLGLYIRGQLLVCLLMAIIASIAFWLAGMKYPLLLGIIIGITDIIPYFGPIIGAIPALIIAATISSKMIVIVGVIILILQFLEGNLLSPVIVGKSLRMHPIIIMIALLLGGEVGGVVGLIIAVPIIAIMKVLLIHMKKHIAEHMKQKREESK